MQPDDSAAQADTARLGQLLRQARLKKGLKQEDVAAELRLQRRQVDALEQGNFSLFNGSAFVKGYLRSCARLYGIDDNGLVHLYEATLPPSSQPVLRKLPENSPRLRIPPAQQRRWQWLLVLVLPVGAVFFLFQGNKPLDSLLHEPVQDVLDASRPTESQHEQVLPANQAEVAEADPVAAVVQPVPVAQEAESVQQNVPAPPVEAADGEGVLHLEFVDDCWVQLKSDNGKVVHEQLHRKGDVVDLAVTTPLHVWFGNGLAVNVSYNGVAVPVIVKPGFQSARFIIGDEPNRNAVE